MYIYVYVGRYIYKYTIKGEICQKVSAITSVGKQYLSTLVRHFRTRWGLSAFIQKSVSP